MVLLVLVSAEDGLQNSVLIAIIRVPCISCKVKVHFKFRNKFHILKMNNFSHVKCSALLLNVAFYHFWYILFPHLKNREEFRILYRLAWLGKEYKMASISHVASYQIFKDGGSTWILNIYKHTFRNIGKSPLICTWRQEF